MGFNHTCAGVGARATGLYTKLLHQFVAQQSGIDIAKVRIDAFVSDHIEQHAFDNPSDARLLPERLIQAVIGRRRQGLAGTRGQQCKCGKHQQTLHQKLPCTDK